MAARSTNTFAELMQRFLADLGQFKATASDEDLASSVELETAILQMLRKPIESMNQQGLTSAPPPADAGGMGNMAAPGPTPGDGMRGITPSAPMPSPDEMRRVLGGQTAQ
jgi:hypothetical protein